MRSALAVVALLALCAAVAWFVLSPADAGSAAGAHAAAPASDASAASSTLAGAIERSDAQRAAVAVAPAADTASPDRELAALRVVVRARESGAPVSGLRVRGVRSSPSLARVVDAAVGDAAEAPITDAEGARTLRVAPYLDLTVIVAQDDGAEIARVLVDPALEAGESRELVLAVATRPDVPWCVRVIDAETRLPIRATISVGGELYGEPAAGAIATDAEGFASLALRSWSREPLVVRADERAPRWVHPGRARERSDPFVVPLARTAAVTIRAFDAAGAPRAGLRVRLAARAGELALGDADLAATATTPRAGPTWDATTGPDGAARIADLPADVELAGASWMPGEQIRPAAEPLVLRPGDDRVVEWRAGTACALHGRAVDAGGAPARGLSVALEAAERSGGSYFAPFAPPGRRTATTDDDGRFVFDDVAAGEWLVGPAPATPGSGAEPPFAPFGQRVEIERGAARADVDVELDRGARITGRVLGHDGDPARLGAVLYSAVDGHADGTAGFGGRAGTFEIGPLRSGEYELSAHVLDPPSGAPSEPIRVRAGGPPVELRLRVPGRIRARVVDARTGAPVEAQAVLNRERVSPHRAIAQGETKDGVVEFGQLLAGTYVVAAHTGDGRFGVSDPVPLLSGATRDDVEIAVEHGGRVELKLDGLAADSSLSFVRDGWTLASFPVSNGYELEGHAPAGRITVRISDAERRAHHDVEIELRAGETRTLVFDGAWK